MEVGHHSGRSWSGSRRFVNQNADLAERLAQLQNASFLARNKRADADGGFGICGLIVPVAMMNVGIMRVSVS
jgi:hypothetical protein